MTDSELVVPSLALVTFRRALVASWYFPLAAFGFSLVYVAVVLFIPGGGPSVLAEGYAYVGPLYLVFGSGGALMIFAADRAKGVHEYLIAYGVRPSALFWNGFVATAMMVSVLLVGALTLVLGTAAALGAAPNGSTAELIALYMVPMTYAGALLSAIVGMFSSTLSTPRANLNSPIGVAPLIGIAPVLLVIVLAPVLSRSGIYNVGAGAAAALLTAVVVLMTISNRWMRRERFLSPL